MSQVILFKFYLEVISEYAEVVKISIKTPRAPHPDFSNVTFYFFSPSLSLSLPYIIFF